MLSEFFSFIAPFAVPLLLIMALGLFVCLICLLFLFTRGGD